MLCCSWHKQKLFQSQQNSKTWKNNHFFNHPKINSIFLNPKTGFNTKNYCWIKLLIFFILNLSCSMPNIFFCLAHFYKRIVFVQKNHFLEDWTYKGLNLMPRLKFFEEFKKLCTVEIWNTNHWISDKMYRFWMPFKIWTIWQLLLTVWKLNIIGVWISICCMKIFNKIVS